ncbi:MAG: hypothetical protein Q7V58_11470 [Actinomycetota bacterium]|nr:hypothetical protein [Actinomycetota bacterium]MDP1877333.1 hypothetical protein [Actinomycetota bacterium]
MTVTDVPDATFSWAPVMVQPDPGEHATVTDTGAPDVSRGRVMVVEPT